MTRNDMEDIDPGLARERTTLAWFRTALAFVAVGGIILRAAPVVGGLTLGMGAVIYLAGRAAAPAWPLTPERRRHVLMLITVTVVLVSMIALVTIFFAAETLFPVP
ncbi:MAG: DUF202 domain-containing protein [Actinomadura sp.]